MTPRQYPLPLPHSEAMAADDYIVTASNRDAATLINSWPHWPSHCLLVLGMAGSGKTHMLNLWLQRSRGKRVPVEALATHDANALIEDTTNLAIDDVHLMAGDNRSEETLFHLYNLLREAKGSLLLASALPPAQWTPGLPDLRSRLLASPVAVLGEPDDELLTMLLIKQFHDRQIEVGADVITYLLPRLERTTAALRDLVAKLDHAALAEGRAITVALARRVLEAGS